MAWMDEPASRGRRGAVRPTPAELAVLRACATGRSTGEVADLLGLDVADVRAHVANAVTKLGARSKLEAVILALRAGWIEIEPA